MIVFFIRRFNDIDHIAPIVYKFAERGNGNILVLCLNLSYDIHSDFRLKFLKEKYNIVVDYVYNYYPPSTSTKVASKFLCARVTRNDLWNLFSLSTLGFRKFLGRDRYPRLLQTIFNEKWAEGLLKNLRPSVLVFDWVKMEQHVTGALVKAANKLRIPTVSVPHGMHLAINEFQRIKEVKDGKRLNNADQFNVFDHFIVQFKGLKKYYVDRGLSEDKIAVLGSSRYCNEWRMIYSEIAENSRSDILREKGKLKVVFMEYPYHFRVAKEIVVQSIKKIASLDFIDLVIKPHTRSNILYADELLSTARIAYHIPSTVLCKWADVVIGTSSSILLEPLLNGKVLIYPKYFHENTMYYETMDVCWVVNNYAELEAALKESYEDRSFRPYSVENVQAFVTYIVKGGDEKRNVLLDYVNFIENVARHGK